MYPRKYPLMWVVTAVLASAVLAVACLAWHARRRPHAPLTVSYWYWQIPFHLTGDDVAELRGMGVHRLFVRAATFASSSGNTAQLTLKQDFQSRAPGLTVCLVFNFHYGLVRQFGNLPNSQLADTVLQGVRTERKAAQSAGIAVDGVQLDLDCPTRLLPKYADFLRQIAPAIHAQKMDLSITALPTWYTSPDVQAVANAVDFMAPQFYEAQIPRTADRLATVSNLALMQRGVRAADRIGRPFYVGIPAYGHALVYGGTGKLIGLYHDMGVGEALRYPAFRFVSAYPADTYGLPASARSYDGEDMVELVTDEPAQPDPSAELSDSDGLPEVGPYHIIYDLPTPDVIAQHIAELRREQPANCRGIILFRFPEPGDEETVPLASVAAVLRGQEPKPELAVTAEVGSVPWQAIEAAATSSAGVDRSLVVRVKNVGTGCGLAGPGVVTITLHFDRPGVEQSSAGTFDTETGIYRDSLSRAQPLPASIERANTLVYAGQSFAPGETAEIGPLRLAPSGPTRVWGEWSILLPNGRGIARGSIPSISLSTASATGGQATEGPS